MMKCRVSALNAQGSRVIIVVVRRKSSENICSSSAVQALRKKETPDETQFITTKILVENLVWVPVISFCKISFPSYVFDALLCRN
jgi:hypothetical protein